MTSLEDFVETTIKEGEKEIAPLEELKRILEELDEEPKIIYASYDVKANA